MDPILEIARDATICWSSRMPARRKVRSIGPRKTAGAAPAPSARRRLSASIPARTWVPAAKAGAVTTDDEQVARTIRMLREHGQVQKYYHELEGYNGRLDAIQAAFLRIKLRHLDDLECAAAIRCGSLRANCSRDVADVILPFEPENSRAIYHLYVIRCSDREALGRTPEDQRHSYRASLSVAAASAEVLSALGISEGQSACHRADCRARFCRCRCSRI